MAMKMSESSLLGEFFPEQEGLKVQILPYMMTRIINIEQVLDALHLINTGKINIEITDDEIVTENNGTWEIDQINEEIKVRKTKKDPDYSGSLTNWTKVLLGHLTLKQAVLLRFIKEHHPVDNDFIEGEVSFYGYF